MRIKLILNYLKVKLSNTKSVGISEIIKIELKTCKIEWIFKCLKYLDNYFAIKVSSKLDNIIGTHVFIYNKLIVIIIVFSSLLYYNELHNDRSSRTLRKK